LKKVKVTLYIRHHSTQKLEVAEHQPYPMGTIFVLRYAGKWETLKNCTSYQEGFVAAMQKQIELFTGTAPAPRPKPKKNDAGALDVLLDKYLDTKDGMAAQRNWRRHTLQCYRLGLKLFMQSCTPKTRLEEIDGDDLRNFKVFLRKYRTKLGKPYDDRSIWNHFNNVVSFLNANGKRNLVEARDWPKFEEKKVTCYDEADLERLFQFADEDEADVLRFFLGVGFRNGEGTHVEWADIDFKNREIHTYSKREKFGWEVKDTEQRIIGISERLAERLKARHKRHPGNGLIFPNTMGKPDKHLLRVIKRVALRAGLNCGKCTGIHERKRVTCLTDPVCRKWIIHTARKSGATFQHREGADVRTIQQDLGHSSLVTTLNYLAAEDRRSAVRRAQINAADARVRQFIGGVTQ
jgi:integrase/recombinase XerD